MGQEAKQRRFRGKTVEERSAERRARLVAAGLHEFGSRGFHDVGVRDVCSRAGLTERYFYESFDNLTALFTEVYRGCVARVRAATDAAIESADDAGALPRAGLEAFFATLQDEPRMARILLIDVLTVDADVVAQSQVVLQSFADMVGRVLADHFPNVAASGFSGSVIAGGLLGATVQIAVQWVFGGFAEPRAVIVDHAVFIFESVAAATVPTGSVPK